MNTDLSRFQTKEELFKFLRENKQALISEKKFDLKRADSVSSVLGTYGRKKDGTELKSVAEIDMPELDSLKVMVVINTTNILDSHGDVHIPGLWKKSLQETKLIYHLQEHEMKFDKIISDEVKAYTKSMTWADLGESFLGNTEALIFETVVKEERNEFMFAQYLKGYVKNHSVGMRYVKIELAINSESKWDAEEKAVWDKYIDQIVNKEDAMNQGYFWAVTEAKVIEGSAVVRGSNYVTPTISVSQVEPSEDTQSKIEPPKALETKTVDELLTNIKFF